MRIEPNIFQLVSRRRQRHKNTNRVWDLDLEFFWFIFLFFFFWIQASWQNDGVSYYCQRCAVLLLFV